MSNPGLHIDEVNMNNVNYDDSDAWMQDLEGALAQSSPTSYSQYIHNIQPSSSITENNFQQNDAFNNLSDHLSSSTSMIVQPSPSHTDIKAESCMSQNSDINTSNSIVNLNTNNTIQINQLHHQHQHQPHHHQIAQQPRMQNQTQMIHHQPKQNLQPNNSNRTQQMLAKVTSQQPLLMPKVSTIQQQPQIITTYSPASQKNSQNYEQRVISFANQQQSHQIHQSQSQIVNSPNNSQNAQSSQKYNDSNTTFISPPRSISNQQPQIIQTVNGAWIQTSQLQQLQNGGGMTIVPANQNMPISIQRFAEGISVIRQSQFIQGQDGVTLIDANNLQPRFVQQAYPNSNLIQINSNDMNQAIYQTQGLNNGPQHILIENANGTQTVQQVIIAQPQGNSNMGINMMQGNNAIILQSKPGPQLPLKKGPQPRQPIQRGNGKKKESPQMIDNSVNIVAHGINSNAGNVSMISNSNMSNQRRQIGKPQLVTQKQGVQSQQISKQQVQMQKQQPHQFQRPAMPQNFQSQQSTLQARLKQQPNNIPTHPAISANEYQVEVTPEDLAAIDTITKQIMLLKAQEQRTGKSEKAKILELEMKRGDIFLNRLGEQHVLDTKVIKDQIYASMPNAGPGAPASTSKPPPKPKAVPKRGSRAAANNESTVKNGPSTSRNHQKQTNNMGNTNIGQSSSKINAPTTGQLAKSMQKSKQVVSNQQNAFQDDSSQFQSNAAPSGMGSGVISSQLNTKNVQGSYLAGNKANFVQNQVVVVNQPPVKYIPSSETQKKFIDNQRIVRSQQMQKLKNSFYEKTLNPDVTTPFKDIDDAFHRLIPYSVFHEAEPSKETLNLFDHDRLRLRNNHTSRITNFMDKLQSKFLKESVEPTQFKAEHLQFLHMDVEYEKRRLGSEKALANTPEVAAIIDKEAAYGIRADRLDEMHRSLKEKNGQALASYKFHFNYDLPVNTRQYIPKDMPEGWRTPINTIFDSDNEERDYKKGLSDSDSETDDGKAGDDDNELTESICIDTNGTIDYREPPNIFQPIISSPLYGSGESKHTLSVSSISTKSSCKVKFNLTPLPSISSLSVPKLVVHRGEQIEVEATSHTAFSTPLMSSAFPPIPKLSFKKVIHPSLLTEPTPSVHSESVLVLPPLKIPKAKLNAKSTTIQHAINSLITSIPENTSPPAGYEDYDGVPTSNGCSNPIASEKTQIPIASIGEGKVDDNESKVEDMSDKERRRQEKKVRKAKKEEKKERKRVKEMEELNNLNKSIFNDSVAATNDCSIVSDSFSDAASTSQPPQRLLFRLNKSELRPEKLLPVMSTTIAVPPAVDTAPLGNEPKVKVPKLKIAREKLHLDPGNSDDSCLKIAPLIVNKPAAHATLAEPVRTIKEHVRSKAGEDSLLVESKLEAIVPEKKERKKSKERKTIKEPRQSKEHKREKKIKLDRSLAKAATEDDSKLNTNDDAPNRLILKLSKLPKLKGEPGIATDVPSLSRSSIDSGGSSVRHKVSESPVPTSDWYKKNPNDNDNLSSAMSNSGKKDQKIKMKFSTPKPEMINVAPAVEDKNSFLSKLEPVKKRVNVVAEPDSSSSSRIDQPPIKMKISIGKKDDRGKEVHKVEEPVVEKIPSLKLSISKARLAPKSNTTPPPIEHRKRKHKETSNDGEEVNADEIERKRKKKEEKKLKKLARLQINGSLIPTE